MEVLGLRRLPVKHLIVDHVLHSLLLLRALLRQYLGAPFRSHVLLLATNLQVGLMELVCSLLSKGSTIGHSLQSQRTRLYSQIQLLK